MFVCFTIASLRSSHQHSQRFMSQWSASERNFSPLRMRRDWNVETFQSATFLISLGSISPSPRPFMLQSDVWFAGVCLGDKLLVVYECFDNCCLAERGLLYNSKYYYDFSWLSLSPWVDIKGTASSIFQSSCRVHVIKYLRLQFKNSLGGAENVNVWVGIQSCEAYKGNTQLN